jgi:hypothetical protein
VGVFYFFFLALNARQSHPAVILCAYLLDSLPPKSTVPSALHDLTGPGTSYVHGGSPPDLAWVA